MGRDEIGQPANALEHFRQQALEVQRLNLVEKLSGVAHEISNPLNFVKNFSEDSPDLYTELTDMLNNYRDRMSDADASLLDELSAELTQSLNRVSYNGGRALAIVERMRGLNVEGGCRS